MIGQLTFEAQLKGFAVDARDGQVRHDRMAQNRPGMIEGRQGFGLTVQTGLQNGPVVVMQMNSNVQLTVDIGKRKVIAPLDPV